MSLCILCLFGLALAPRLHGEPHKAAPQDNEKLEQQTRLQIFLDQNNFGPGKIDGQDGEFTKKALEWYRAAHPDTGVSQTPQKTADTKAPSDTTGLDLSAINPVFITYQVTKEDLANVGNLPSDHAAEAKLHSMPYRTAFEAIAEKFHSDPKFLQKLNPQIKGDALKEGDSLKVPNVKPFEVAQVKQIKPGEAIEPTETVDDATEKATPRKKGSVAARAAEETDSISLDIRVKDKMLVVMDGQKVTAAFPVTPGSTAIPSPIGQWKIERVAKMPNFRWDEKMLMHGERSSHFHLLPPGPNNPVGVMWIALNKKGIGIHGTDDPDSIGRAASHGCIRLANWDVVKLAKLVKPGVPVTIE